MSNIIKELGARFSAVDNGINVAFEKLENSLDNIEKKTGRANRSMSSFFTDTAKKIDDVGTGFQNVGNKIIDTSKPVQNMGKNLTNWITKPALIATTAVAGIVGGLGAKRLVAMDTAKAKLEGMGYAAKDVKDITDDVSKALETGMMTLGEGVDVAAGALAAGVEQGDDLQRYIKLVDSAAVVAGRSAGDMAQIFNRVQGSGKLMTMELNMIEQGMPGFAKAMADYYDVSLDTFRDMVTAGEVSSEDFLEVMDNFAGGAAAAYAKSFSGMWVYIKSYIGKIGEGILSGLFERTKDHMVRLVEILSSEAVQNWAVEFGEKVADTFDRIVEKIKTVINWWKNLDDDTQSTMLNIAKWLGIFLVAIGPVLTIVGTFGLAIGKLVHGFGTIIKVVGSVVGLFGKVGPALAALTNPVGLVVLAITGLATGFVIAYKRSERFREVVGKSIDKVKAGIEFVKEFATAIKELFMGDQEEGNNLLEKLGLSESQIEFVNRAVDNIKTAFSTMKELATQAFSAVGEFFGEMVGKITSFWNENGEQTMQAIHNAIKVIGAIIEFVAPIVQTVFVAAFKVALFLIKEIWNSIKGVIDGGLNFILGLVKIFTGIFTGDFSKMWEGVKQAFVGAIQFIWHLFSLLFYGRIIKSVGSLVKIFSGSIRTLWTTVVNFFKNMFNGAVNNVTGMYNRVINIGKTLSSTFRSIIDFMRNRVVGFFKNLYENSLNQVKNLYNGAKLWVGNIRDNFVNGISKMKNRVVDLYKAMKNKASEYMTNMVDGAKALPGRIKDAIVAGKNKAVDGIKSLGNSMTSKLGDVVNGVIGGLNTVLGKVGVKSDIKEWTPPSFSTGTGAKSPLTRRGAIAYDTMAVVGDRGPGNGKGVREIVEYPNGAVNLFEKETETYLPKGSKVYNNRQSEKIIPHLSTGTGAGTWDKIKGVGNKIKDIAANALDYITNPKKVFDAIVDNYFSGFNGISGFAKDMIGGAWNKIKSGMLDWIKGKFATVGGKGTGKKQSFMNYPITSEYSPGSALAGYPGFNGGRHYGIDYGTPFGTPIHAPTGGTVKEISNLGGGIVARLKSGDITQFFMHLSQVLKEGTVKMGELIAMSGNSGAWTTGPHVHWQAQKGSDVMNQNTFDPREMLSKNNGVSGAAKKMIGFARGGFALNPQLAWLAEGGFSESIISHDPKYKARSKDIYDRTGEILGFNEEAEILERIVELLEVNNSMSGETAKGIKELVKKELKLYLDSKEITDAVNENNAIDALMSY